MVMRKLSVILQDLLSDPEKLRAAAEAGAPIDESGDRPKPAAELPGCTGGVTSEPPTEDTAATFPGVLKLVGRSIVAASKAGSPTPAAAIDLLMVGGKHQGSPDPS